MTLEATLEATLEERVNLLEKEVARLTLFLTIKMTPKIDLKMLPISQAHAPLNATPKPLQSRD